MNEEEGREYEDPDMRIVERFNAYRSNQLGDVASAILVVAELLKDIYEKS